MSTGGWVPIPDTHRTVWPGTTPAAEVADGDVWLTAWLRTRNGGELDVAHAQTLGATLPSGRAYAGRSELSAQTTCDPKDVDVLQRYCARYGIDVVTTHWRSLVLSGPIRKLIEAFGVTAAIYKKSPKGWMACRKH